jgi:hypothetical protein
MCNTLTLTAIGNTSSNLYHLVAGRIVYRIYALLDGATPGAVVKRD